MWLMLLQGREGVLEPVPAFIGAGCTSKDKQPITLTPADY